LATERKLMLDFVIVINQKTYSQGDMLNISSQYETSLNALGKSQKTLGIIMQLAKIYTFYLDEPSKGEQLVQEGLTLPINALQKAKLKILLGDIYVVSGKIWDASLMYMQVEKKYSEDIIGHEAKFKNAKVFYYDGEFEYAKAQLDVLKASTSKLIANDAMQLSLLLQDNLGIDTTRAPVQIYANADLLLQQNKFDEALIALDSLEKKYPFHSLADEVIFKKAEIYEKLQQYVKAIELYDIVCSSYSFDILGDDAAFRIAQIYEYKLDDKVKAKEYYKLILFEFKSSLYTAKAIDKFNSLNIEL
jgi:tetratricopeptide (TPR) repeat protein